MTVKELMKILGLKEIVTLDFETYYDQQYSLRSTTMSTTEYIRDPQFKAHLVGIRTSRQRKARWVPHDNIAEALKQYDWSTTGLIAHHAQFDGLILSHHYKIVPAFYFCTMSMARPLLTHDIGAGLDEVAQQLGFAGKTKAQALDAVKGIRNLPKKEERALGEYCEDDVNDTFAIFEKFITEYTFPLEELLLIHYTVKAYADPVLRVNKARAQKALDSEIIERNKRLDRVSKLFTFDAAFIKQTAKSLGGATPTPQDLTLTALRKDPLLAAALTAAGCQPPTKWSVKQKKTVFAFAKGDLSFQLLEAHPNEAVRDLYAARLAAKSTQGETRAQRLLSHSSTGPLPIYLNYAKAHTFRWSGGDKMNPQNFGRGSELRASIIAPPGYHIAFADSSQIEARVVAWMAQQKDLLEVFANNGDPYCELAQGIYKRPINKHDNPTERFVGKVGVLGLGFGMGAEKFQYTLAVGSMGPPVFISLADAQNAVNVYRRKNSRIVALWSFMEQMLTVMLTGGRYEFHPEDVPASRYSRTAGVKNPPILVFRGDGKGNGFVDMPNGLTLHYPDLKASLDPRTGKYRDFSYRSSEKGRSKIYGGLFTENVVQALARIIVGQQSLKVAERYRVVLLVHDEVVFLVKIKQAKAATRFAFQQLSIAPAWCASIPVSSEVGHATNYS